MTDGKRVAILGGGVAGMTAAHELIDRGFQVAVYELKDIPGGKARSIPVPESGRSGRRNLPGEHGFRFFPGFYRHLPDTMRRIPYRDQPNGVYDNLVTTSRVHIARIGRRDVFTPAHFPASVDDVAAALNVIFTDDLGLPLEEQTYFAERLLVLLTSCHERRFAEYEDIDWWTFVGADERSPEFQKYCADGLSRCLVALRAKEMSTRTGGYILLQLMLDIAEPGSSADRILTGPTNEVWITPWFNYLTEAGVDFHFDARVEAIQCEDGRITGVTINQNGAACDVTADYYLAALPVEVVNRLVTESMKEADPVFAGLGNLRTAWMVGLQFYLDREVAVARGHTLYMDSPWALTSITQKQFWPDIDLTGYGNGQVKDILSVDVSDWDTPGILHKRAARQCTPDEIQEEVWAQIKAHYDEQGTHEIENARVLSWFLDPAIVHSHQQEMANLEPLLINTKGSWRHRPEAVTKIDNFFLAADYVRTHTDLATMEAANEAGRRAVNGILDAGGSSARRAGVWPLRESRVFAPLRYYDRMRFRRGMPHDVRPVQLIMRFPHMLRFMIQTWRTATGRRRVSS